jgi:hypothetical protein
METVDVSERARWKLDVMKERLNEGKELKYELTDSELIEELIDGYLKFEGDDVRFDE